MPRKKRLSVFRIILELIILYLFSGLMFSLGYITGIFYLVTITLALFSGILFKRKNISWMIILGTILSYFAGKFVLVTIGNALAGDIVGAAMFGIIALLLWSKGRKLKKGKK
jgi:hypothetical protein